MHINADTQSHATIFIIKLIVYTLFVENDDLLTVPQAAAELRAPRRFGGV
jgi:hypothetical protein